MRRNTHYIDNSIHYPSTVNVQEKKAPTDESVRILNEMQQSTIDNIVAKIPVTNNIVNGVMYIMDCTRTASLGYKITAKFKINNHEFVIDKDVPDYDVNTGGRNEYVNMLTIKGLEYVKAVMLWYALTCFSEVAFEQIVGCKMTEKYLNDLLTIPNTI